MTLAIDFDNTIHDRNNREADKTMGNPIAGAIDALEELYRAGHRIIIHTLMATSPSGKQAVTDWLDHYGVDYHQVTATKPNADYYIDDKAVRFTDWPSTFQAIGFEVED